MPRRTVPSSTAEPHAGSWHLVDDLEVARDGAAEMEADLALLDRARSGGEARLRIYRFHAPTLTIGRFQPDTDVDVGAATRLGVDVARRPTGGRALLHGAEVTYAVALRRPPGTAGAVDALYCTLADALVRALAMLGVTAAVAPHPDPATSGVCLTGVQGADLRVGGRKVSGSAQLQRSGWVLQHGSILLGRLPFDEVDLLRFPTDDDRAAARAGLRSKTVTLEELGAPTDRRVVADALISGFTSCGAPGETRRGSGEPSTLTEGRRFVAACSPRR